MKSPFGRSNRDRRLRLARRAIKVIDGILSLQQAHRCDLFNLVPERERELDQAACILAETLGRLLVHDRQLTDDKPLARTAGQNAEACDDRGVDGPFADPRGSANLTPEGNAHARP
jgi:hypothetical protein